MSLPARVHPIEVIGILEAVDRELDLVGAREELRRARPPRGRPVRAVGLDLELEALAPDVGDYRVELRVIDRVTVVAAKVDIAQSREIRPRERRLDHGKRKIAYVKLLRIGRALAAWAGERATAGEARCADRRSRPRAT